ncbi:YqhR family membrane protein [Brevibacillus sp. GCM10020057]|uniref:YqhR family membrane protein n=1 Tax=Brevibacillus sp. GCM10020057 TaxID=3317327 RepID=UPI003635E18E
MEATKARKGLRGWNGRQAQEQQQQRQRQASGGQPAKKIVEVALWGTIFWGIIRMAAHFLNFTPYGLGAFARPILTGIDENTAAAIGLGAIFLFVESLIATALFSALFRKVRVWWSGLLLGAVMLAVAGYFFVIGNWEVSTLSTEAAWYLSYGLFAGMTLTLEESDEE